MTRITMQQAAKEIRAEAKKVGLTFKRQDATINGKQAYMFTDRATGLRKLENCTFWNAYENYLCGYVGSYNMIKGSFTSEEQTIILDFLATALKDDLHYQ